LDPKPIGKNKRVNKWVGLVGNPHKRLWWGWPSSSFDENLQMVYLIHQLSFDESMVKYTQKVMN